MDRTCSSSSSEITDAVRSFLLETIDTSPKESVDFSVFTYLKRHTLPSSLKYLIFYFDMRSSLYGSRMAVNYFNAIALSASNMAFSSGIVVLVIRSTQLIIIALSSTSFATTSGDFGTNTPALPLRIK